MIAITDVTIDAEFRQKLTPNPQDVVEEMEASVRQHGFFDPIKVWKGTNILIDGHHRYGIWLNDQTLPPPEIVEVDLADRQSAISFILEHQLNRRNLSPKQAALYRGELYNSRKSRPGGTGSNQHTQTATSSAAEEVAAKTGVSARTVKSDGRFAQDVAAIQSAGGTTARDAVVNGPLTREDAAEIAAKPASEIPEAVKQRTAERKGEALPPPPNPQKLLSKAKAYIEKAVDLTIKCERANGGECVYSRNLARNLNSTVESMEVWLSDLSV